MTFTHIGVHCHELGHIVLGLDDMYKNNNIVGTWGLMAYGNMNGPEQGGIIPHMKGACPTHPTILNKIETGLGITPQIAATGEGIVIPKIEVSSVDNIVVYQFPVSGDEYFIVENRQCQGFDAFLPPSSRHLFNLLGC